MKLIQTRALRGPNFWSRYTALEIELHCDAPECALDDIAGFEERLRSLCPGIADLRATGHQGPLTLAHALEASLLALQAQAGCPISFSCTTATPEPAATPDPKGVTVQVGPPSGQIKRTTQRHGTEGLPALLKRQFELAQLCCGPVDGQARRKSAGLFERTGGGEDVGTERTRHRLRQQLGSESDVVFAADFSLQRGSVWQQNSQRCA